MEHLDTGTLENWYANRAMPTPALLQRLAVIAPDDAPGLAALRQRLAQRSPRSLNCDHFAAGFNGVASASLASAFEQIRQRHATDPYDIVLLLEGRPEALGIAESNGLIPEQVSRTPVPVWTAVHDPVVDVTQDVLNQPFLPALDGHMWASFSYTQHLRIWAVGGQQYCVRKDTEGTWVSFAGLSPGLTGTISDGLTGTFTDTTYWEWTGTLSPTAPTSGFLGVVDAGCTAVDVCADDSFLIVDNLYFPQTTQHCNSVRRDLGSTEASTVTSR